MEIALHILKESLHTSIYRPSFGCSCEKETIKKEIQKPKPRLHYLPPPQHIKCGMGTICVLLVVWKELFCHTLLHSSHLSSAIFCVNDWVQLGASKEGLLKSVRNHARKGFQEKLCGTLCSSVKL